MRFVDAGRVPGAETDMVQTDGPLHEALSLLRRRRRLDPETGASADAVEDRRRIGHDLETEKRQQLGVEGAALREVAGGDEDVRDAVDFHGEPLSFGLDASRDDRRRRIKSAASDGHA